MQAIASDSLPHRPAIPTEVLFFTGVPAAASPGPAHQCMNDASKTLLPCSLTASLESTASRSPPLGVQPSQSQTPHAPTPSFHLCRPGKLSHFSHVLLSMHPPVILAYALCVHEGMKAWEPLTDIVGIFCVHACRVSASACGLTRCQHAGFKRDSWTRTLMPLPVTRLPGTELTSTKCRGTLPHTASGFRLIDRRRFSPVEHASACRRHASGQRKRGCALGKLLVKELLQLGLDVDALPAPLCLHRPVGELHAIERREGKASGVCAVDSTPSSPPPQRALLLVRPQSPPLM